MLCYQAAHQRDLSQMVVWESSSNGKEHTRQSEKAEALALHKFIAHVKIKSSHLFHSGKEDTEGSAQHGPSNPRAHNTINIFSL